MSIDAVRKTRKTRKQKTLEGAIQTALKHEKEKESSGEPEKPELLYAYSEELPPKNLLDLLKKLKQKVTKLKGSLSLA